MQPRHREQMRDTRIPKGKHHLVVDVRHIAEDHAFRLAGRIREQEHDAVSDDLAQMEQAPVDVLRGLPEYFGVVFCKRNREYLSVSVVEAVFIGGGDNLRIGSNHLTVGGFFREVGKEPKLAGDRFSVQRRVIQIDAILTKVALFRRFADSSLHNAGADRYGDWRRERNSHEPQRHADEKHRPHRFFQDTRGEGADEQDKHRDHRAKQRKPVANHQPEQESKRCDRHRTRVKPRR